MPTLTTKPSRPSPAPNGSHEHESCDFLGYTFRPRKAKDRHGQYFVSFLPAVSNAAAKAKRQEIRRWRMHLWTSSDLRGIAATINPIVRGWINYYGRFYRSRLSTTVLRQINEYPIRWAMRKYQRLRFGPRKAAKFLAADRQI
jgi:RNA-directed DNA polymerase